MSEVYIADQVPPAPVEIPTDSRQDASKGKEAEAPQGKDKGKDKGKGKGKGKASETTISQPEQAADPGASKAQVEDISFCSLFFLFFFFCLLFLYLLFVKEMYHTFVIKEDIPLLLHKS